MGDVYVAAGGGGGTSSDDVTATRDKVLAGYTAVTADSGDEPINGTMPNQGAWTGRIGVNGRVEIPAGYHNGSGYVNQSIPDNGGMSATLNCGQSKSIPTGYTSGGTVTANSLASQTSATASAGTIKSGYTAWVNGSRVTGTMPDYSYLAAGQVSF